jgi:AcrR family transcriptional regulator
MATRAPRSYHHGNLRAALLERAEGTLRTGGAGRLSLRELPRDIGVSHAAPRRHFADKQALLDALAHEGFERLGRELAAASAQAEPAFEARLAAIAHAYVRFATRHAALLELMFAAKHRPGADEGLAAAAERAFAAPRELIADGQATGAVVGGDPERVMLVALAGLQGLVSMANAGMIEEAALDGLVTDAVDHVMLGLRPR